MAQTGFDLELEQLTLSKIQDKFFGHMQSLFKKETSSVSLWKNVDQTRMLLFPSIDLDLGQCYNTPSGNNQSLCEVT